MAQRRALGKEDSQVNILAASPGLRPDFSSTVIVVMLILKVAILR